MYFVLIFLLQIARFLERFTLLAKKITLPPAGTALTNLTSVTYRLISEVPLTSQQFGYYMQPTKNYISYIFNTT